MDSAPTTVVPEHLIARVGAMQPPVAAPEPDMVVVALASLARGGAERIVLDWVQWARQRGARVVLGVLHRVAVEWPVPADVTVRRPRRRDIAGLLGELAAVARGAGRPVYTHLLRDAALEVLWRNGAATVPTLHNARAGWRNDVARWTREHVPCVLAVADAVAGEFAAEFSVRGTDIPTITIRHRPRVGPAARSPEVRARVRAHYGVAADELLVGMIGSIKPQKNYALAFQLIATLRQQRHCRLLVAGGCNGIADRRHLRALARLGANLQLGGRVLLPGFVDAEAHLAAFDVLLNTSHYEGLSVAVQEALLAGVPVVATAVGGQVEIVAAVVASEGGQPRCGDDPPALQLFAPSDTAGLGAALRIAPIRNRLLAADPRCTRNEPSISSEALWQLAARMPLRHAGAAAVARPGRVLFITANLNAGGAQRSLVNLLVHRPGLRGAGLDPEVVVCQRSTHPYFQQVLATAGVPLWRPGDDARPWAMARAILARLGAEDFAAVCFWNVDPRLKLLLAKFLPRHRIVDVSPGHYAFEEMARAGAFGTAIAFTPDQYYRALERLVVKYAVPADVLPAGVTGRVVVVPNGVAQSPPLSGPEARSVVISGRLAASKRWPLAVAAIGAARARQAFAVHVYGQVEPREAAAFAPIHAAARAAGDWHFHGAAPEGIALLGRHSVALVLGTHQGCPNSVLEALAAGVPVVANASGGTGELVRDGWNGVLTAEDPTVTEVADALVRALRSADAWRDAARASVAGYTFDRMAAAYAQILGGHVDAKLRIAA